MTQKEPMNCPKCAGTLQTRRFGDVEVDQCDRCKGVWLELGELPDLIAYHQRHGTADYSSKTEQTPAYNAITAPCPRCGGQGHMTRVRNLRHPQIVMDSCSVCYGIWLDGGELDKLVRPEGVRASIKAFFRDLLE